MNLLVNWSYTSSSTSRRKQPGLDMTGSVSFYLTSTCADQWGYFGLQAILQHPLPIPERLYFHVYSQSENNFLISQWNLSTPLWSNQHLVWVQQLFSHPAWRLQQDVSERLFWHLWMYLCLYLVLFVENYLKQVKWQKLVEGKKSSGPQLDEKQKPFKRDISNRSAALWGQL